MPSSVVTGRLYIRGVEGSGNRIQIIGGSVRNTTEDATNESACVLIQGVDLAYLEGIKADKADTAGDCFIFRGANGIGGTLYLQNCLAVGANYRDVSLGHSFSQHGDGLQVSSQITGLFIDKFTIYSWGQGYLINSSYQNQYASGSSILNGAVLRRMNVHLYDRANNPITENTNNPRHCFYLQDDCSALPIPYTLDAYTADNCYAIDDDPNGDSLLALVAPGTDNTPECSGTLDETTPQSSVYWTDRQITGRVYAGTPPDGDYVSSTFTGLSYTTPGYATVPGDTPPDTANFNYGALTLAYDHTPTIKEVLDDVAESQGWTVPDPSNPEWVQDFPHTANPPHGVGYGDRWYDSATQLVDVNAIPRFLWWNDRGFEPVTITTVIAPIENSLPPAALTAVGVVTVEIRVTRAAATPITYTRTAAVQARGVTTVNLTFNRAAVRQLLSAHATGRGVSALSMRVTDTTFILSTATGRGVPTVTNQKRLAGIGEVLYGTVAASSLQRLVVGSASRQRVSFRFEAKHTGQIDRASFYNAHANAVGTGGTLKISIYTNNPNANDTPGTELLSISLLNAGLGAYQQWRDVVKFTFSTTPPALSTVLIEQNQIYHLVFENTHADEANNYVYINTLFYNKEARLQPLLTPLELAVLTGSDLSPLSAMTVQPGYSPIFSIWYTDHATGGYPYTDALVWLGSAAGFNGIISGTQYVRQTFTPTTTMVANTLGLRYGRFSGSDDLTCRIEDSSGVLIENVTFTVGDSATEDDASAYGTESHRWVQKTLAASRTFTANQEYRLVLSAPSTSQYRVYPVKDHTAPYAVRPWYNRDIHVWHEDFNNEDVDCLIENYDGYRTQIMFQSVFDPNSTGVFSSSREANVISRLNSVPQEYTGWMIFDWEGDTTISTSNGFMKRLAGYTGVTAEQQAAGISEALRLYRFCKALRPNIKFGFYRIPFWQANSENETMPAWWQAQPTTMADLFAEVDVLAPEIYQQFQISETATGNTSSTLTRSSDATRMQNYAALCLECANLGGRNLPIAPFVHEHFAGNGSNPLNGQPVPLQQWYWHHNEFCRVTDAAGDVPVYASAGTHVVSNSSGGWSTYNVPYPAVTNAGDLLILQSTVRSTAADGVATLNTAGWNAFPGNMYGTSLVRQGLWWRISDGTEAGTNVSVTASGTTVNGLWQGRIWRFTCTVGFDPLAPVVSINTLSGTASPLLAAPVSPTGLNQLAVNIATTAGSDSTMGSFAGETGGNWTEADHTSTGTGGDGTINVQTASQTTGLPISGGSVNWSPSQDGSFVSTAFALVPGAAGFSTVDRIDGLYYWGNGASTGGANLTEDQIRTLYQAMHNLPFDLTMPKPALSGDAHAVNGRAEYSTDSGGTYRGWKYLDVDDRDDADLQFYFGISQTANLTANVLASADAVGVANALPSPQQGPRLTLRTVTAAAVGVAGAPLQVLRTPPKNTNITHRASAVGVAITQQEVTRATPVVQTHQLTAQTTAVGDPDVLAGNRMTRRVSAVGVPTAVQTVTIRPAPKMTLVDVPRVSGVGVPSETRLVTRHEPNTLVFPPITATAGGNVAGTSLKASTTTLLTVPAAARGVARVRLSEHELVEATAVVTPTVFPVWIHPPTLVVQAPQRVTAAGSPTVTVQKILDTVQSVTTLGPVAARAVGVPLVTPQVRLAPVPTTTQLLARAVARGQPHTVQTKQTPVAPGLDPERTWPPRSRRHWNKRYWWKGG
jgi:hypothetical protein